MILFRQDYKEKFNTKQRLKESLREFGVALAVSEVLDEYLGTLGLPMLPG